MRDANRASKNTGIHAGSRLLFLLFVHPFVVLIHVSIAHMSSRRPVTRSVTRSEAKKTPKAPKPPVQIDKVKKRREKKKKKEEKKEEMKDEKTDETEGWSAPMDHRKVITETMPICRVIRALDDHWRSLPQRAIKLSEAQKIVGGYVEVIAHPGSDRILIVNDEAGINDEFPRNRSASLLAGYSIFGDVIFCESRYFD